MQNEGKTDPWLTPIAGCPASTACIGDERIRALTPDYPVRTITDLAREELDAARRAITAGDPCPPFDAIVSSLLERIAATVAPTLRPVINATGIIIHTNLGRAPLSDDAVAAMEAVGRGYSNLELDLDSGERGSRHVHLERSFAALPAPKRASP